ncbi:SAYSvFN domain-containing protein [Meloidogyne graminicola]|uniref:SAYSvFN domain-containing protein n=1 Tax=Meloidogyne graminicola TaxID=189291 RepID=A0A8S9ZVU7_9BILA|nr:SAYSvFN domain-containing protein [Meloidogyne graminicola]
MRRIFNNQSKEEKPLKAKLLNYRKNKKQIIFKKETDRQNNLQQQQTQNCRHVPSTSNLFNKVQQHQNNAENVKKEIKKELLQLPKPAWRSILENFGFDILDNYPMRKWREFCAENPLMCWLFTGITWAICQFLAAKAEFVREEGELSAYSVFNENFIRLEGELTSEDFENEILMRRLRRTE